MSTRQPQLKSFHASSCPAAARWAWGCVLLLSILSAKPVLFFSTGDPSFNTTAPVGRLANSGWQYQGAWGSYCGTVISSNCFLTARHVGGTTNDLFQFQGVQYPTVAFYDDPETDLRIWRVSGQFPIWAPLYVKTNERGKPLVVIGRGTQRGAEVRVNNKLRGWEWGLKDGVQRWGQNRVRGVLNGGPGTGEVLRALFVAGGGRNEAQLSSGDSGGAVFIKDGKVYKLAGINIGVDGPYNTTNSGTGFDAALFNEAGFCVQDSVGAWFLVPRRIPGGFYATRISSRLTWINSIL